MKNSTICGENALRIIFICPFLPYILNFTTVKSQGYYRYFIQKRYPHVQVRGPRLKDTVDVSALKPCVLALGEGTYIHLKRCRFFLLPHLSLCLSPSGGFPAIARILICTAFWRETEEYDGERAVEHVRRLLDIVACTTCFGPSASAKDLPKADLAIGKSSKKSSKCRPASKQSPPPKLSKDTPVDGDGDMSHSSPKLGSFYEFFSLSHLTPPLQCNLSFSLPVFR